MKFSEHRKLTISAGSAGRAEPPRPGSTRPRRARPSRLGSAEASGGIRETAEFPDVRNFLLQEAYASRNVYDLP
mgnify:CR=1 FL=1